jgi:precorrin-3B synthase
MTGFKVQGWCPDAWHPMAAGDGLWFGSNPIWGG